MGETLRPNLGGDETALNYYDGATHAPDVLHNFEQVDDTTPDDASTYVYRNVAGAVRDLYNLPAHSASGVITGVEVFFRCLESSGGGFSAKPVIKSDSTITEGTAVVPTGSFVTYSQLWATNPGSTPPGQPWGSDWSVIDNLQIGVKLEGSAKVVMECTQVYVSVYTFIIKIINETIDILGTTADFCSGGIATADSVGYVDHEADKAFDNIYWNNWCSANSSLPHWVKYDLGTGKTKTPKKLRLIPDGTGINCAIKAFKLQGSNNDSDWTDILSAIVDNGLPYYTWQEWALNNSTAYRYYRIYVTSTYRPYDNYVAIDEIELLEMLPNKRLRSVKLIAETVGILEDVVKWPAAVILKIINETIAITELTVKRLRQVKLVAETVTIVEGLIKRLRTVKIINETINIVEAVVKKLIAIGQPYIARVQRIFGMRTWGGN